MPAVLKHLNVLEQAGLIAQEKTGRVRMVPPSSPYAPMQQASDWLSLYRIFWENQLNSLGRYLQRTELTPPQKAEDKACRKPPSHPRKRS